MQKCISMKYIRILKNFIYTSVVIIACLFVGSSEIYAQYSIQKADFTDATFHSPQANLHSPSPISVSVGTLGTGVQPQSFIALTNMKLNPKEGLIEIWAQPQWNGSDGEQHLLWQTNKANNRQLIVEKSEAGMLRAQLSTPMGLTVARSDVSHWKQGEWHHIAVGWVNNNDQLVGLPLWVDQIAVDGPITPYGVFDSSNMPDTLFLGSESVNIIYDELLIRPDLNAEGRYGMVACIYRDYFRTAPYDKIEIDPRPTRVPSDLRAIAGQEKQFGLQACRQGKWEPVTEQVVRYNQWAYFDAKHLIRWGTSNPEIATIDSTGRVKALQPGACTISAEFHSLKTNYNLTVIPADKPDIGVICIQLTPSYRNDAVYDRPKPGDLMTAHARFGNFGNKLLLPGTKIRFSLIPDSTRNYQPDQAKKPQQVFETTLNRSLSIGEETEVTFTYSFPNYPSWMKLELDYDNDIDELCEANNNISELCDARPIQFGFKRNIVQECLSDQQINHIGSFSYYDWLRAEKLRMDLMLREAKWPTTGPNGVEEAYRIDTFTELAGVEWENEPYNKKNIYYDGGFPVNEPVDLMAIDCAIIHEFGHTILSQPDLYGYPMSSNNVFITDNNGNLVAGTPVMPVVKGDQTLQASGGINVPCYVGYPSLMDGCQLWLHPSQAGHVMHYKGYRQDRFWGTQGMLIPTRANWLIIKDAFDHPLRGAAIYVYHVSQAPVQDSGAKYFSDRPKFTGQTDDEGRFIFPQTTDENWDDPETDTVDGAIDVWNPFGTKEKGTAFTPNVWSVEGLLLIKIVASDKTEFHFMDLTQFNTEFLSGNTVCGKYKINTSLLSPVVPTPIVRKPIPKKISQVNKRPIAVAPKKLTVKRGEEFEIDGSQSYDPEGQPLIYRWHADGVWLTNALSQTAILKAKAPDKEGEFKYKFWVLDGVRCSKPAEITVQVM